MGRSMIWNSIPFMTTVDVLIIAVTVYAIWSSRLIGPSKRPSAPKNFSPGPCAHWGLSTIRYAREPKLYNYVNRLRLLCSESIWLSLRPAC
jgi:hypothetical protein